MAQPSALVEWGKQESRNVPTACRGGTRGPFARWERRAPARPDGLGVPGLRHRRSHERRYSVARSRIRQRFAGAVNNDPEAISRRTLSRRRRWCRPMSGSHTAECGIGALRGFTRHVPSWSSAFPGGGSIDALTSVATGLCGGSKSPSVRCTRNAPHGQSLGAQRSILCVPCDLCGENGSEAARPAVAPYLPSGSAPWLLSVFSSASLCPLWRIEVSLSARCAVAARA